jgi:tetratricopeptide (TPR) repeat protein
MRERIRIFVSSPGDVTAPREIAAQIIERLAQDFARFFSIDPPYLWQNEPLSASRHFQDDIELPSAFDIVILILHQRIGTPLPEKTALREYRGIDGRVPVTGTEWEYEEALKSAQVKGAPDLLVYRSRGHASVDSWDAAKRGEQLKQLEALDIFWARHFRNQGVFLGAYTEFQTLEEFASRLESHLRQLLTKKIDSSAKQGEQRAPQLWMHAPFRGLESYEFEHAQIFFGQDDVIRRAMLQFTAHASAGTPFLIVLGASGSGKSSLVKAGIIPKLLVPRRVTGLAFLRRVEFRPSDTRENEDIFSALARRLTTNEGPNIGLPELVNSDNSVAELAVHLRTNRAMPAYPISLVLDQITSIARANSGILEFETAQLVLVIDQLEEIFTNERFTADTRREFIEMIAGLVHSGRVWVVAAMRKDFWHRVDDVPELAHLADDLGRIDLLPPSPAQIGQMIKRPAEAAGLEFELLHEGDGTHRSGVPLNEIIAEEIVLEPGALPLLSYLLDQLYRKDVLEAGGRLLTFGTYERLGKLEGAIATKAEEVIAKCEPEERDALGAVLFSLVQLGNDKSDIERYVARRVPLAIFPAGTPRRRLIEAFLHVDARLLVSDLGDDGVATLRVAHEALLTNWPRAKSIIEETRSDLRLRARLEQAASQWSEAKSEDRDSLLLRSGLPLSEAEDLVNRRREDLSSTIIEFVKLSTDYSTKEQRQKLQRSRRIAIAALSAAFLFCIVAVFAGISWRRAQRSLDAATGAITGLLDTFQALQPAVRLDQAQLLVDQARNAIDRFSGVTSDSRLIDERARTFIIVANIEFDRGNIAQMRTDATEAVSLLKNLADHGDIDARYERAESERIIGISDYQSGRKEDAKACYDLAITELKALLAAHPHDSIAWEWERALADTQQVLGDVLLDEFNSPDQAVVAYNENYKIRLNLKSEGHQGPEIDHDLYWATNKLGDVEGRIGHDAEALKLFQSAQKGMLTLGSNLVLWPYDLPLIDNNIGLIYMRQGDYAQAQSYFQDAEGQLIKIIGSDPSNNIRQSVLGWTYDNWGEALVRWGMQGKDRARMAQARLILVKALDIRMQVAKDAPDKSIFNAGVLNARANIAIVDAAVNEWNSNFKAAAEFYAQAADLIAKTYVIHWKQYARPDRLLRMVEMRRNSASAYKRSGDAADAGTQISEALQFLSGYSGQLDQTTYNDTVRQLQKDNEAIKSKN